MFYICTALFYDSVPLCNGSTADFGSVSLGSNPSGTTVRPDGGIGRHASFRD